jgi:hypothetical protein
VVKSYLWEKKFISDISSIRGQDRLLIGASAAKVDKKLNIPALESRVAYIRQNTRPEEELDEEEADKKVEMHNLPPTKINSGKVQLSVDKKVPSKLKGSTVQQAVNKRSLASPKSQSKEDIDEESNGMSSNTIDGDGDEVTGNASHSQRPKGIKKLLSGELDKSKSSNLDRTRRGDSRSKGIGITGDNGHGGGKSTGGIKKAVTLPGTGLPPVVTKGPVKEKVNTSAIHSKSTSFLPSTKTIRRVTSIGASEKSSSISSFRDKVPLKGLSVDTSNEDENEEETNSQGSRASDEYSEGSNDEEDDG